MANRRNYFFDQLVQEDELDAGFDGLENADWAMIVDTGLVGVASGLGVSQHSPTPDLTVDVAIGAGYDKQGRRLGVPSLQVVNLAVDSNSVSTSVLNVGQSKIVSVFLRFRRAESDPRTDGNAVGLYFIRQESFEFFIEQGAEAGSPTPPALRSDSILLADITRTFGQTQIVTGNISTTRREMTFKISAGAFSIAVGTAEEAAQAALTLFNNHVTSVAAGHPASAIANTPAGTIAATDVQAAIDELDTDRQTVSTNLANHIASATAHTATNLVNTPAGNIAATTVQAAINELDTEKGGLALANTWTTNQVYSGGSDSGTPVFDFTRQFAVTSEHMRFRTDQLTGTQRGRLMSLNGPGSGNASLANNGLGLLINAGLSGGNVIKDENGQIAYGFKFGDNAGNSSGGLTVLWQEDATDSWTTWTSYLNITAEVVPSNRANVSRMLSPKNLTAAWALLRTDGIGGITVVDGFNVASASIVSNVAARIDFARDMADTNYVATAMDGTNETFAGYYKLASKNVAFLSVGRTTDGSIFTDLEAIAMDIMVVVTGLTS